MIIDKRIVQVLAAAVTTAGLLTASGCGTSGPDTDAADSTAVQYFEAADSGDYELACKLSRPSTEEVQQCIESNESDSGVGEGLTDGVEVLASYPWPQPDGSPEGRAVVVESTHVNGNKRKIAVGLLPGPGDPPWYVDRFSGNGMDKVDPENEEQVIEAVYRA